MNAGAAVSLALFVVSLCGCSRAVRAPHGTNISSEASDYSPVVRLAIGLPVAIAADRRALVIQVDSGSIRAPGKQLRDTLPIMRDLHIAALIVFDGKRAPVSGKVSPSWIPLGVSDSVPVARALRLGQEQWIPAFKVRIDTADPFDPETAFLVFRVTGAAVTREADTEGTPIERLAHGAVRVYACAPWTLAGFIDSERAQRLALAYNAAC